MITKERLEELLEEDKVFYWVFNKEINMLHKLSMPSFWERKWEFYSKDCFETKEDAEEYAEFGKIPRIEWLELPSWEEFNSTKFSYWFMGKNEKEYHLHNVADEIYIGEKFEIVFNKPLTRENYDDARRLCIKLFKGE